MAASPLKYGAIKLDCATFGKLEQEEPPHAIDSIHPHIRNRRTGHNRQPAQRGGRGPHAALGTLGRGLRGQGPFQLMDRVGARAHLAFGEDSQGLRILGWRNELAERVMPDEVGTWRYRTQSRPVVAGLDAQEGSFDCRAVESATGLSKHGAIRVASGQYHLEHADSTPFFWLGDTVWNGPLLSEADDWACFLKDRAEKHFNVIQFNAIVALENRCN